MIAWLVVLLLAALNLTSLLILVGVRRELNASKSYRKDALGLFGDQLDVGLYSTLRSRAIVAPERYKGKRDTAESDDETKEHSIHLLPRSDRD